MKYKCLQYFCGRCTHAHVCVCMCRGGVLCCFVLREGYFQLVGDAGVGNDRKAFPPISRFKMSVIRGLQWLLKVVMEENRRGF